MSRSLAVVSGLTVAGIVTALGWASRPGALEPSGDGSPGGAFKIEYQKASRLEALLLVNGRSPQHIILVDSKTGRRLARSPVFPMENLGGSVLWSACTGEVVVGSAIAFKGLGPDGLVAHGCSHPPPPAAARVQMIYDKP